MTIRLFFISLLVSFSAEAERLTHQLTSPPHILFLNVNHALTDAAFADAVGYVEKTYALNVLTNACERSLSARIVTDGAFLEKTFGPRAKLIVALEKSESGAYLTLPGRYAAVNLNGLDRDAPSPQTLTRRTRQMALKGLAFACGVGSNSDPRCVMFYQSFSLKGLDSVSATYGPYAYFPICEILKQIAGDAIFLTPDP